MFVNTVESGKQNWWTLKSGKITKIKIFLFAGIFVYTLQYQVKLSPKKLVLYCKINKNYKKS